MSRTAPILLSFYALSNGKSMIAIGQLTYSSLRDFSFKNYGRRKTFRSILALYRTRFFDHEAIELEFDSGTYKTITDEAGSFFLEVNDAAAVRELTSIKLINGQSVELVEGLYTRTVHTVQSSEIIVSDIDDTLLHSHISNKLLKFRTLLFTSVEKRKAVKEMMKVIHDFADTGTEPFYLSNSEQNLYPLIYRFLRNNNFPRGPLFLKQMRHLRDVFRRKDILKRDVHKLTTLEKLLRFFPDKKFILIGDNTQNDLKIYLSTSQKFPESVRAVIIRKVISQPLDRILFSEAADKFKALGISFYYDKSFPNGFELKRVVQSQI